MTKATQPAATPATIEPEPPVEMGELIRLPAEPRETKPAPDAKDPSAIAIPPRMTCIAMVVPATLLFGIGGKVRESRSDDD